MNWNEISEKIDKEIIVGTEVPKTGDKSRIVTRKKEDKIYMRTGVKTQTEKYITKEMLQYAYDIIKSGRFFNSGDLNKMFPKECSQGGCVFSMTGGIFVLLEGAKYIRGKGYFLVNEK